ncbi:MAG: restriction endonuclease subunit S [Candidatus Obscuribacterales bacterium]
MPFEYGPHYGRLVSLTDVGELSRGKSKHRPRHAAHLYGGPYPFIQTGDIKASQGRIRRYCQTYSEAGLAQSKLWPAKTLCITIAANIAETAILEFSACFPDSVVGFVADERRCNVYYVEYLFRLMRAQLQQEAAGTVQDNINIETLQRVRFRLPSLPEQDAVVNILKALDDRIILNEDNCSTLETFTQKLYKSWFVDFEPVTLTGSDHQKPLLSKRIQSLFPDAMEETDLGTAPIGWRFARLDEAITEIIDHRGKTPRKLGGDWIESGVPVLSAKNVKAGRLTNRSEVRFISDEMFQRWMPQKVQAGDILLTSEGPLGETYFWSTSKPVCLGQRLFAIRANATIATPEYIYHWLNSTEGQNELHSRGTGTTVTGIRQSELRQCRILLPPITVQKTFVRIAEPALRKIHAAIGENDTLSRLRDLLLPRLLSGSLQLATAEKLLEAAL